MSDPSPPPLDPRVRALLRDEGSASPEVRARARARLAVAIPGLTSGSVKPDPGLGGSARVGTALGGQGVAILAFVLGGAAGAGLHAALTRPSEPRIVYTAPPATPPPAPSAAPSALSIATVAPPLASAPFVSPQQPPTPHVSQLSQLTAERSALDAVRALLVQGDPGNALDRLRASRRDFPRAILGEERDALTVEALVGAHRYDEARTAGDAFREHYPGSLFSGAVDGSLRSIP